MSPGILMDLIESTVIEPACQPVALRLLIVWPGALIVAVGCDTVGKKPVKRRDARRQHQTGFQRFQRKTFMPRAIVPHVRPASLGHVYMQRFLLRNLFLNID